MAQIPVEKKSGKGWLWALLALLLLALLAWWLLDDDGNDAVEYTDNESAATAPMEAGAMTVGENVDLQNVSVTSLAGDMAFNANINGQNMLVLFDELPTPNDATEGNYDINEGSVVNLQGSVRSAADPLPEGVTAQVPAGTESYIFADSIEMVS